jgi:hypothetical protein
MRVGIAAQSYTFPAPTGVADLSLRTPGNKTLISAVLTRGPFDAATADLEAQIPLTAALGVDLCAGYRKDFDVTDIGLASDGPGLKPCGNPPSSLCLPANTPSVISNPGTWVRPRFSLVPLAGKSVFFRFLFTSIDLGGTETYFTFFGRPNVSADDGWYIDDVVITGAVELTSPVVTDIGSATGFNFSSAQVGDYVLDARAKVYGGYSLDWGPIKSVSVSVSPPMPTLTITQSGDNVLLTWDDMSFQLQSTPTLDPADWTTVPGTLSVEVPKDPSGAFFRLIK